MRPCFPKHRLHLPRVLTALAALTIFCFGFAASVRAQPAPRALRFGVNPWGSEKEMRAMFKPLMAYLEQRLGVPFEIVIPTNYDDLLARVAAGELDLISFNSVTFLQARRKGLPVEYIATMERLYEGETEPRDAYTGYFIVRKDSPYRSLKDLRGKTFAFVDESSASGYKMPRAILGIRYNSSPGKFFKKFFFVGDHDEVMSAVYHKCVDGGATWDNSYALNTAKDRFGDNFRIIEKTPPIPNDAWAAGPAVTPAMRKQIRNILLSIDSKTQTATGDRVLQPELGFPGSGWSLRSPQFYEDAASLLLYEE